MKIASVRGFGVGRLRCSGALQLGSPGVYLITGENGAGKSSVIESVPLALWGKTLRGKSLWNSGEKKAVCEVDVEGAGTVSRYSPAKKGIRLECPGSPTFESTKHAQAHLDSALPIGFQQWRKACVLSSADASTFALATDTQRKQLVESIVGASHLGEAYADARALAAEARGAVERVSGAIRVADARLQEIKKRLADTVPEEEPPAFTDEDKATLHKFSVGLKSVGDDLRTSQRILTVHDRSSTVADMEAEARSLATQHRRLYSGTCPMCSQPVAPQQLDDLVSEIESLERKVRESRDRLSKVRDGLVGEVDDLSREESWYRQEVETRTSAMRAAEGYRQHAEKLEAMAAAAAQDLAEVRGELGVLREELADTEQHAANWGAVVQTLSPKGVRAHLIDGTLHALEIAANSYLSRLGSPIQIELRPYTEKKTSGVSDSISLRYSVIRGDDDSFDGGEYRNASGGERRRIDLAITFGLAKICEASYGLESSTWWCDEIFDALDQRGVSQVCALLQEEARERAIVVVSHHAVQELESIASAHYVVQGGELHSQHTSRRSVV